MIPRPHAGPGALATVAQGMVCIGTGVLDLGSEAGLGIPCSILRSQKTMSLQVKKAKSAGDYTVKATEFAANLFLRIRASSDAHKTYTGHV